MQERVAVLCTDRLGLEGGTVQHLLDAMARTIGRRRYWVRAAAFAVAVHPWGERALPARLRRRAVAAFAGALLDSPAARNVYGAGRSALLAEPGAGLLRRR